MVDISDLLGYIELHKRSFYLDVYSNLFSLFYIAYWCLIAELTVATALHLLLAVCVFVLYTDQPVSHSSDRVDSSRSGVEAP